LRICVDTSILIDVLKDEFHLRLNRIACANLIIQFKNIINRMRRN
jgi:hypothetical protein